MSEITAYHEAGHAFVALQLGARVLSMTVDPEADDDLPRHGDTEIGWPQDEFSESYFTDLISFISLDGSGRVTLHTKTDTEIGDDNNASDQDTQKDHNGH